MTVSRLPFALEDLLREIQTVSGNEHPDVTLTLDAATFGQVISELNSHQGGLFTIVMHPGCPPEHRYKGVSIVKREESAEYGHQEYGFDAKAGRLTTTE